jgi:hypothetical protein
MLTARDVKFLTACGIATDEENFRLETLWWNWQRANLHRDFSPCRDCGAKNYKQHALDCKHGAAMVFVASTPDDGTLRLTTEQLMEVLQETVKQMSPQEKAEFRQQQEQSHQNKLSRRGGSQLIFTRKDRAFLLNCGIDPGPAPKIAHPDGTQRLMERYGLDPTDRDDYLRLAFGGNPPLEPLDGEIEAELSLELQMTDVNNAPSAGECDEPSYTTPGGFPICSRCGKSTRNKNQLVCRPCESRTRLILTAEDRQWLRQMGIAR